MREQGLVIKEEQDKVVIQLTRQDACEKCGACSIGAHDQEMVVTAENHCGAKEGDWVYLDLEQSNFFKAAGIMYGLPLGTLLMGFLLGYGMAFLIKRPAWQEPLALTLGLGMMAITFLWIRSQEQRWSKKDFRPIAVGIVEREEEA